MWKIIVGILILALLVVTNRGKEAHWTECEATFEANAAKESRNASWLDKFGFWLLKDSMKDSIQSALERFNPECFVHKELWRLLSWAH